MSRPSNADVNFNFSASSAIFAGPALQLPFGIPSGWLDRVGEHERLDSKSLAPARYEITRTHTALLQSFHFRCVIERLEREFCAMKNLEAIVGVLFLSLRHLVVLADLEADVTVQCDTATMDDGKVSELCFTHSGYVPSTVNLQDRGNVDFGGFAVSYEYWGGLAAGTNILHLTNASSYYTGYAVHIDWTDSCTVKVNNDLCSDCVICSDKVVSVDCTVVPLGRSVNCESIEPFFFPLDWSLGSSFETPPPTPVNTPRPVSVSGIQGPARSSSVDDARRLVASCTILVVAAIALLMA